MEIRRGGMSELRTEGVGVKDTSSISFTVAHPSPSPFTRSLGDNGGGGEGT